MTEIPQNGRMLEGRYQLVRLLKKGGMGEVYTAKDCESKDFVIVKKTRAEEALLLSKLSHPGIVRYLDSFSCADEVWLVEEYVPGETLSSYVRRNGPLNEASVIEIGLKLCEILIYLHGLKPPVIYRDLKPDNIMLEPDGKVKLIDFGIAKEYVKWEDRDTNHFGTKGYAAPEQYGEYMAQSDARSDIFGLGKVLQFLLTNGDLKNPVSKEFIEVLRKCTEAEPLKRFQSVEVLAYELKNLKSPKRVETKNKQGLKSVLLVIIIIIACTFGIVLEFLLLFWLLN